MKLHVRTWATAALLCAGMAAASAASAATYTTILTGPQESPPNTSEGIGAAAVQFDTSTHVLQISFAFAGLEGDSTVAHIHCCTAAPGSGSAIPATELPSLDGFPTGVKTGAYSHFFDTSLASNWNPAFLSAYGGVTGAENALWAGLNAGSAYLNIHSTEYPNGEIRGFLMPVTAVPEPAGIAMLGLGLPALLLVARRRKST
ncbi:CHRD domain-containing protein [Duganella radicis]|uniref:CHRD domain-containing protein n=1 Tax=Duganella radicis TaxID=551988 RepID=A0A6L6PRQ8_9BURK|nr:CHRD domain-containing protein [Duganella radicis]MTV41783.1 CHRD domain-containing protein [Duganella radicis]